MFIKCMEILEKVSNIIKNKLNSELMYSKQHLNAGKNIHVKEGFPCLYAPIILIDSFIGKMKTIILKCF